MKCRFIEEILEYQAQAQSDNICIRDIRRQEDISYRELAEAVSAKKKILGMEGVEAGKKIIFMLKNGRRFAEYFYAVVSVHAIATPVNPSMTSVELEYVIDDLSADFIITGKEINAVLPKNSMMEVKEIEKDIYLYKLHQTVEREERENSNQNTAVIMYTSGSTGKSKGVILSHRNLISKMRDIANAHALTNQDVVLCVLPWFHINGLVITLLTPMLVGHEIVVAEKFSVTYFWKWIQDYRISWFSGVPTIYSYLLSNAQNIIYDIRSLRFARSASSSLSVSVLEEFERRYRVPIIESYGITEGCSQITSNPIEKGKQKPGSVGIAYGNQIKIVDETGKETCKGVQGEVWIKGENITQGYYRKQEETEKSFCDGWFKSGDIGYLDEEGYLFLSGRKKELINRAGEKFSPREIDEVLYEIDGVELACAVGVPDEIYGEEVVAFVKLRQGAKIAEGDIKVYCGLKLSNYKIPKEIIFTEEFPQGENGKIQRLKFISVYQQRKDGKDIK